MTWLPERCSSTAGTCGSEKRGSRNEWGSPASAVGSSGSIQFPDDLVDGISSEGLPATIPGTRRGGGIIASLTGGLEGRREAIASATLHALSTQFFGVLEGRPESGR